MPDPALPVAIAGAVGARAVGLASYGTQSETFGERLWRLREARGLRKTVLARQVRLTEAATRQLKSERTRDARLSEGAELTDARGGAQHATGHAARFTPLTVLLRRQSPGFERTRHGLHVTLDCLPKLGDESGHVVTPDDPQANLAIQRLLAALHLALFGTCR